MLIFSAIILISATLALIYVFLVMPRVTDTADMELQSTDYAHRGLHGKTAPENSLTAFSLACDNGYGIELDVRMSSDGEIFVFHDENLRRVCGINKPFSSLSRSQLSALRIYGGGERIPRLSEVLELIDGRVPILIEVKSADNARSLCKALCEMLDGYEGAFAIQSFDPRILAYFKKYRPRFARGQLVTKIAKTDGAVKNPFIRFALNQMLTNVISRPDFISIDGKMINNPAFLLATFVFRNKGFVWTVHSQEQYTLCQKRGLYAIFEKFNP